MTEKQQMLEHNLQDIRKRVQVRLQPSALPPPHCLGPKQRPSFSRSGYGTEDEDA